MKQPIQGFTLVEALIVTLILGILASLAYTNYQKAVLKSNRSVARGELMSYARIVQSYYTTNGTFETTSSAPSAAISKLTNGVNSEFNYYSLKITVTATTFTLTATPISKVQLKDKDCASFTLNQLGVKAAKNSSGDDSTSKCWN